MIQRDTLEEILTCPALPTLPAIAVRVLELTQRDDVKLDELASAIQNDQALSAKVLRTVNSSFYGLRQSVTTIRKAIVLLGLGPVRSLALGFSLVSSLEMEKEPLFDYVTYWRRAVTAAVAARLVAERMGVADPDEAFLAGLLSDIGMVAMYRALGDDYLAVVDLAGGDHARLGKYELEQLGVHHAEIGALLAERWRLPAEVRIPIKYHERPTASPNECAALVRCVGLGLLAYDVLNSADAGPAIRKFYERGKLWFKVMSDDAQELLKQASESAKQVADLLEINTGTYGDPEAIIRRADASLTDLHRANKLESYAASQLGAERGEAGARRDAATGALDKSGFQAALVEGFGAARAHGEPISLVQVAIEGLAMAEDSYGPEGREAVLGTVVMQLIKAFDPLGGVVARVGPSVFAVVMPGQGGQVARREAESFRRLVEARSGEWAPANAVERVFLTCSVGVSCVEAGAPGSAEGLIVESAESLREARREGGNRVSLGLRRAA